MASKELLIEGETDRQFFTACCRMAGFAEDEIRIGTAKAFDPQLGYGKSHALKVLPQQLQRMAVGELARLGLVIDADFRSDFNGFDKALSNVLATDRCCTNSA